MKEENRLVVSGVLMLKTGKDFQKGFKFLNFQDLLKQKKSKKQLLTLRKSIQETQDLFENFNYPTTHALAKKALIHFLTTRLHYFGEYEDSIAANEEILFHSCLSPILNIGLLTPKQVVDETIKFSEKKKIPINSLEGFIRQVIGWREFVRGVYHTIGKTQRKGKFF
jgi:deoxyribodipyrimidine photolyase-like uncharacterized protein